MIGIIFTRLWAVASLLTVVWVPGAQAAAIASAQIVDLYSATFDGALDPTCGGSPDAELCAFFNGNHFLNPRNIEITSQGSGSGTIEFDGTTITALNILLPDMLLVIVPGQASETIVQTDSANSPLGIFLNIAAPATDNTPASSNFQVEGAPQIVSDFASFTDFVDVSDPAECTGDFCGLIGVLSLDGVRYQLSGGLSPLGGDELTLFVQTNGNSVYEIAITTAAIAVPAALWLFGSALTCMFFVRRRFQY